MSWDKESVSPKENVFVGSILIAKRVAYHNANADDKHHYVGVSYIRPGDFIVMQSHVVYAVSKWDDSARQIRVIEAYPGRKEVRGEVLVQTRSARSLGRKWVARRWVVR